MGTAPHVPRVTLGCSIVAPIDLGLTMWPRAPAQCWGGFAGFPASSGFPNPPSLWQGFFLSCGFIGSLVEALGNVLYPHCAAARRCSPPVPSTLGSSRSCCLLLSLASPYPEVTRPGGKNNPVLTFQLGRPLSCHSSILHFTNSKGKPTQSTTQHERSRDLPLSQSPPYPAPTVSSVTPSNLSQCPHRVPAGSRCQGRAVWWQSSA